MALTPAEKQRRYRVRQSQKRKAELKEPGDETLKYLSQPFFAFFEDDVNSSEFTMPLELAGIEPPAFSDDAPAEFPDILEGLDKPAVPDSIKRAELTVSCLADAARALAGIVNRYKRKEITNRIREIENETYYDYFVKAEAFKEHARLQKMLDQLDKQGRWTFPQWKVAGE